MEKSVSLLALTALVTIGSQAVQGGTITGQQIIATFSNPVLAGTIPNDPGAGQYTFLDNTNTAVYNISNDVVNGSSASSSMSWGQFTGTNTGFDPFSLLVFVGSTIPSSHSTTDFDLGSLTFLNGTSDLTSLIFGATMSFYTGSVSPSNLIGTDTIYITTTSNIFGVPGGLTNGDDDYVNICGTFSSICSTSIEAVESSETATPGVVVDLSGVVVGDPQLSIDSVALEGGQNSSANGFLGNDSPGSDLPEPGTWGTVVSALGLILMIRRRNIRRRVLDVSTWV